MRIHNQWNMEMELPSIINLKPFQTANGIWNPSIDHKDFYFYSSRRKAVRSAGARSAAAAALCYDSRSEFRNSSASNFIVDPLAIWHWQYCNANLIHQSQSALIKGSNYIPHFIFPL